jgi:hypothetical protein
MRRGIPMSKISLTKTVLVTLLLQAGAVFSAANTTSVGPEGDGTVCEVEVIRPGKGSEVGDDEFQLHMDRLDQLLRLHPQYAPEIDRMAAKLQIEDTDVLVELLGLFPLEVEVPLRPRKNRGVDVTERARNSSHASGSGIVVDAASKLLASIPVKTDTQSAQVINGLQQIEDSRQEAVGAKKGWLAVATRSVGKVFTFGRRKVSAVFDKDTVLSRVEGFKSNVQSDIDATQGETEAIEDNVDDLDINIATVRVNLAAALKARRQWRNQSLPEYNQKFQTGQIDQSTYGLIIDNANRLDQVIRDIIIMESTFTQFRQMAQDKAKDSRNLVLQYQRILSQTVPMTISLMTLYFTGKNQEQRAGFIKGVRDFTNALALENTNTHREVALRIAQEAERGILDAETVQTGFTTLIGLFEERLKIAQGAANQRAIEGVQLRGKLTEFLDAARASGKAALQLNLSSAKLPKLDAAKSTPALGQGVPASLPLSQPVAEKVPVVNPDAEKSTDSTESTGLK